MDLHLAFINHRCVSFESMYTLCAAIIGASPSGWNEMFYLSMTHAFVWVFFFFASLRNYSEFVEEMSH